VSVLTGGLSVWNTVEVQGLKNKVSILSEKSLQVDKAISQLTTSRNIEIEQIGQISALMGDFSHTINNIINYTDCLKRNTQNFQLYVSNWLYSAPSEFLSAYSGALTGKVTPFLLSAHNLRKILLSHNDLRETFYEIEPEIVYEFGKTILT